MNTKSFLFYLFSLSFHHIPLIYPNALQHSLMFSHSLDLLMFILVRFIWFFIQDLAKRLSHPSHPLFLPSSFLLSETVTNDTQQEGNTLAVVVFYDVIGISEMEEILKKKRMLTIFACFSTSTFLLLSPLSFLPEPPIVSASQHNFTTPSTVYNHGNL
jgi:hypothetical protein